MTTNIVSLYLPGLDEGAPGPLEHPPGRAPRVPPPQHQALGGGRPEWARSIVSSFADRNNYGLVRTLLDTSFVQLNGWWMHKVWNGQFYSRVNLILEPFLDWWTKVNSIHRLLTLIWNSLSEEKSPTNWFLSVPNSEICRICETLCTDDAHRLTGTDNWSSHLTREVSSDWGLLRHFLSRILTITLCSPLPTLPSSPVVSSSSLKSPLPLSTSCSLRVLIMFMVDLWRPNLNRELCAWNNNKNVLSLS